MKTFKGCNIMDPIQFDAAFNEFMQNLQSSLPEGVIEVNLALLEELGLLKNGIFEETSAPEQFPHYFHVIETTEKVTLFNHQFLVWIVPKMVGENAVTLVLIALMTPTVPRLELAFSTSGVYNTPKFILRLLRHYLSEVIDTEEAISSIDKPD